jgi:hypothetical protein
MATVHVDVRTLIGCMIACPDGETAVHLSFNKPEVGWVSRRVVPGYSDLGGVECWSEKPEVDGSTPPLTTTNVFLTRDDDAPAQTIHRLGSRRVGDLLLECVTGLSPSGRTKSLLSLSYVVQHVRNRHRRILPEQSEKRGLSPALLPAISSNPVRSPCEIGEFAWPRLTRRRVVDRLSTTGHVEGDRTLRIGWSSPGALAILGNSRAVAQLDRASDYEVSACDLGTQGEGI